MFENEELDPRDCLYRLQPKLRKQITQIIMDNKLELEPSSLDEQSLPESSKQLPSSVVNRMKKELKLDDDESKSKESVAKPTQLHRYLTELDKLFNVDEDKKQCYSYEDLSRMHQLLQYIDPDGFCNQFFYQFLEDHCRVVRLPEKRKNVELDARIRHLKYRAANNEYNSMTSNVAKIIKNGNKNRANANSISSKFSLSEDMKAVRSSLMAIVNAFMVIVATFAFVYVGLGFMDSNYDMAKRVLYSFLASMMVAVAEVYFLIRII